MAPRAGRITPHRQSQALRRNGDVPPTLAAQIADQLAHGNTDPRNQDRESLHLLLQEVLEANDDSSQPDGIIGNDAAINCRLICVIVRAGLGQRRISSRIDEQHRRAEDVVRSLRAIDLTISRCPDALFHPLDDLEPPVASDTPLFAWLIPRILDEIRELKFEEVEQHALEIIHRTVLIGENTSPRHCRSLSVSRYMRVCVTRMYRVAMPSFAQDPLTIHAPGVLSNVEHGAFSSNRLPSLFGRPMSASAVIQNALPVQDDGTDRAISCQIVARSACHGFAIISFILLGLLPQTHQSYKRHTLSRQSALLDFVLSSLGRSWNALTTNVGIMNLVSSVHVGAHVRCLRSLLLYLVAGITTSTHVFKASSLLSSTLSVILACEPPASNSLLESEVCQALFDLSFLAQKSMTVSSSHSELLVSRLSELVNSPERFLRFGDALKVCSCTTSKTL